MLIGFAMIFDQSTSLITTILTATQEWIGRRSAACAGVTVQSGFGLGLGCAPAP